MFETLDFSLPVGSSPDHIFAEGNDASPHVASLILSSVPFGRVSKDEQTLWLEAAQERLLTMRKIR